MIITAVAAQVVQADGNSITPLTVPLKSPTLLVIEKSKFSVAACADAVIVATAATAINSFFILTTQYAKPQPRHNLIERRFRLRRKDDKDIGRPRIVVCGHDKAPSQHPIRQLSDVSAMRRASNGATHAPCSLMGH